MSNYFNVENCN